QDQPRERGESRKPMRRRRDFPEDLKVRDKAWDQDQVKRAIADHLVGDVDIAAFGVAGFRWRHRGSPVCATPAKVGIYVRGGSRSAPGRQSKTTLRRRLRRLHEGDFLRCRNPAEDRVAVRKAAKAGDDVDVGKTVA